MYLITGSCAGAGAGAGAGARAGDENRPGAGAGAVPIIWLSLPGVKEVYLFSSFVCPYISGWECVNVEMVCVCLCKSEGNPFRSLNPVSTIGAGE